MSDSEGSVAYEFGSFRLEPRRRMLFRIDGGVVVLTDKAFDALVYLVEHAGRLVTKNELLAALWPDTVVEENSLYAAISSLRRTLKDESSGQRLIATVAGRGYQFVAEVRTVGKGTPPVAAPPHGSPTAKSRRWPLVGATALALAIAFGATLFALRDAPGPRSTADGPTLAVLPFKPLTPDDRHESLELGMAETLIAGLGTANLKVSPLSSVRRFTGSDQDVLAAGRALGVQSVLEGHIQRAGGQLRVSARLLNVSDGRQLWAQSYNEPFTDIFSVQDAIAERVRAALTVELSGETPALRRYTNDAEAYQLYANGRVHYHRLALPEALAYYEQAVARDPGFALAHVAIADVHAILGVFGAVAPHDTFPKAQRAVQKALELAPDLGQAHASLGHIKVQYELDWAGAERAYRRALELNPNSVSAQQFFGIFQALQGRFAEGIAQLRRAQALEPAQPVHSALIGMILVYQRRYDAAIGQLQSTLDMDPDFPTTNNYLAMAHLRRGDYDEAMGYLDRVKSMAPGSAAYRGQIFALSGRSAEARQEIDRLLKLSQQRYVPAYDIATIYAALGEVDETFDWLGRAFEERSQLIGWLQWDPVFDAIRADPRYAPLVRRLPAAVSSPA